MSPESFSQCLGVFTLVVALGRMQTVDTKSVTYDALGRAVEFGSGSPYTQVVYGPLGNKLALMNGQTLTKAFVPLPGGPSPMCTSQGTAPLSPGERYCH